MDFFNDLLNGTLKIILRRVKLILTVVVTCIIIVYFVAVLRSIKVNVIDNNIWV